MPVFADDAAAPDLARPDGSQQQSAMPHAARIAASGRPATALLPDQRDEPLRLLTLLGPVVAISVLTILGLTITFRALNHDRRQRRNVYRQRGHGTRGRTQ
jgi:hypothetical protein